MIPELEGQLAVYLVSAFPTCVKEHMNFGKKKYMNQLEVLCSLKSHMGPQGQRRRVELWEAKQLLSPGWLEYRHDPGSDSRGASGTT